MDNVKNLKLKIRISEAITGLLNSVKDLKEVGIEVAAEVDDNEIAGLVELFGKISEGVLPLEILNAKLKKDIEAS